MSKSVKSNLMRGGLSVASLLGLGLFAGPQVASAQAPAPAASSDDSNVVVITAQKRPENLQDVPIVVNAFGAQKLQDAGVKDIKDLSTITPGLTVTTTGSAYSTTARIRGVGTVSDNIGLEDQVGVVIDGVPRPRNGVAYNDLGELSDIEVIKGPQGTLFGKNTTAGVLQINTKRPSFSFGANAEVTGTNFAGYGAALSVTGPLIGDKLAGRLYLADRQRDGYYHDRGPGVVISDSANDPTPTAFTTDLQDLNNQDMFTTRGQLLYQPSSNFDVNFIGDYTTRSEVCCGAVPILIGKDGAVPGVTSPSIDVLNSITGPEGFTQPTTPNPKNFDAYYNLTNVEKITDTGVSAEAHWKLGGGTSITSITSWRNWLDKGNGDPDYSGVDFLRTLPGAASQFETYSEEARIAGETDRLTWLAGLFAGWENLDNRQRIGYGSQTDDYFNGVVPIFNVVGGVNQDDFVAPGELGNAGQDDIYHQRERSLAFFTQETLKATDKLNLTAGLRYTMEHKTLNGHWSNTGGSDEACIKFKEALGVADPDTNNATFTAFAFPAFACAVTNDIFHDLANNKQPNLNESALTGTAKAEYHFTNDLMSYASYSRGFLAGGYNFSRYNAPNADGVPNGDAFTCQSGLPGPTPAAPDLTQANCHFMFDTSFKPTHVDAYEIGTKSRILDGRMTLNGAIFYQRYTDFQLNQFNGLVFVVTNVPQVVSRGAELDVGYHPFHALTLNGGVTYADTYYPATSANKANLDSQTLFYLPGSSISLNPKFAITAGAAYQHALMPGYFFRGSFDAKWQSRSVTGSDLDPAKTQSAFTIVNARVGLGSEKGWTLELWSDNVFNALYKQVAFNAPFQTFTPAAPGVPVTNNTYDAFLGAPRTVGLTLRAKF